ncbi:major facilitator superfamily transporter [Xylariales sp. AK1849]|nr:major facilitator superfamily transporter [Xylariales sp. AK1849]
MTVSFEPGTYDATSDSDVEDAAAGPQNQQAEWKPTGHELLIIITLAIVSLLVALDASIIVTSLAAMVTDLKADTTSGFWIGTSYLLVNAVTMPVIASVSEIFGRPICLEFALVMFTIGTIFCCAAQNVAVMLIGRCIQGVGGGGVHVLTGVIMTDLVPLRFRPKWFGIVLAAWAFGTCIGPLVGGAIAQNTTWRWVFYLMFPLCVYGLVAVPALLTIAPRTESLKNKLLRVDWFGCFLFMSSATLFLIAICWGGTQYAWNSAATLAPLIVGIVGLILTLVWEVRFAKEPLFRRELFHDTSSIVTYICGAAQGFLMWGPFYYYPFYFLAVMQTTPVNAGVNLLPAVLVLIPGSIITGRLVTRWNNYRYFVWSGWLFVTIFAILSVTWRFLDVTTAVWVITLIIFGFGQGAVLNAQQFATQAMCQPGDEGHAAAMYLFLRQFGAAVGVGVGGTTFQNVMALKLQWESLPTEIANEAEGYIAELHKLPDGNEMKNKIIDAYRFGFAGVFQVYLGVAAVAFVLSVLFVKHYSLDKNLSTEHTLRESRTSKLLVGKSGNTTPSGRWSGATTPNSRWSSRTDVDGIGFYQPEDPETYQMKGLQMDASFHQANAHNILSGYTAATDSDGYHSDANSYYTDPNVGPSAYMPQAYHPKGNVHHPNLYHVTDLGAYDPYGGYHNVDFSQQRQRGDT